MCIRSAVLCLSAVASFAVPVWAQQAPQQQDLTNASIEDLMNIKVTSVSKTEQPLSRTAAAIFVITQEDIRRSGATNIPDLLRMVPGLEVAQIDSNTWAISSRGFNLQFANKLLVLIDGRAVYTPLFGGVNWDTQDLPLDDIERIEVIRGPGGTLWGANAVDGVINIITKKAADTQGARLTAGGGTVDQGFGTLQYGGTVKTDTSYRVFTKYLNEGHFPDLDGQDADDAWHLLHGGFRLDSVLSRKDSLTTQGDIYTGSEGAAIVHSILSPPANVNVQRLTELSGGNILSRWSHKFSDRSKTTFQFYFDRYARAGPESNEVRNTIDFDFQHEVAAGARQDFTWGVGYRRSDDKTEGTIDQAFVPANQSAQLFNSFLQDQIALKPDRVFFSVGTKLENNYFSGFDLEPSARIAWTPSDHRTFWAAISRASRSPTQRDVGLSAVLAVLPGPTEVVLLGNPNIKSEHVLAYELGYRGQPSARISVDVSTFFNEYQNLESVEPLPSFVDSSNSPPLFVLPSSFGNGLSGTTAGVEVAFNWKVSDRWTVSLGYSFLEMRLHTNPGSADTTSVIDAQGSNPGHQAQVRSRLRLSRVFSWDTNAYFVGSLPAQLVPSYTRLDTQLTWGPEEHLELSLVGQNLLKDHHLEFNDALQSVNSSQVKRSVYAKVTWNFK